MRLRVPDRGGEATTAGCLLCVGLPATTRALAAAGRTVYKAMANGTLAQLIGSLAAFDRQPD
jgi:hypothetical protein